jgi:hypothetical protein
VKTNKGKKNTLNTINIPRYRYVFFKIMMDVLIWYHFSYVTQVKISDSPQLPPKKLSDKRIYDHIISIL